MGPGLPSDEKGLNMLRVGVGVEVMWFRKGYEVMSLMRGREEKGNAKMD